MIVEQIENLIKADEKARVGETRDLFRASGAGRCTREQAYQLLGVPGEPLTPRRRMTFDFGNLIETQVQGYLKRALGDKWVNGNTLGDNHFEIDGIKISYHIDFAFQHSDGQIGIGEIKSMADFSFERAIKGELDEAYLAQAWCYQKATDFNPVVFVCVRKETNHMVEIIFDRDCKELVVTQRLGGDVKAIELEGPLLLAEVRTPFDERIGDKVARHFRLLSEFDMGAQFLEDIPGVNAIEDETISVQGKAKADLILDMGVPEQSGSWYKFKTGRKVAKFPCSYCAYIKPCLGAELEIKNGKPVWVIE